MEQGKDRLMSTAEAADRLGVSPRTIARWIKAGELRGVRLGRRLFRVPESEVLRIIAETYEREDEELDPRDILDGVEHTLYVERGKKIISPEEKPSEEPAPEPLEEIVIEEPETEAAPEPPKKRGRKKRTDKPRAELIEEFLTETEETE